MKKTDEVQALDLIKKLYSKKTVSKTNSTGITYDPITIVEINLLRSLLRFDCKDFHIIKAILAINDISTIDIISFENSLKEITQSESVKDRLIKWEIIIPLEIILKRRKLMINGVTFKILRYSSLRKLYPLEYYHYFKEQKFDTRKIENQKCQYLVTEAEGFTFLRAWKTVEPSFNLLRGLLDFVLYFNTWTFFSFSQTRTSVIHPKTIYGVSSQRLLEYLDFNVQKTNPKEPITLSKKKRDFEKYSKFLQKKPDKNSINDLLSDIFRLYCEAMDEQDLQYSFLRFWQIVERIALNDPNGPSLDSIKKRILYYTDPTPEFNLSPYIDKLSSKRNQLVHKGIDDVEETDFNILKSICERAIVWLFFNRSKLKTINHLDYYYTLKDLSDNKIKANIDTLTYIKRQRRK